MNNKIKCKVNLLSANNMRIMYRPPAKEYFRKQFIEKWYIELANRYSLIRISDNPGQYVY